MDYSYFTMYDGMITNNTGTKEGGGVYCWYGTLDRSGGEITGNTADSGKDIF